MKHDPANVPFNYDKLFGIDDFVETKVDPFNGAEKGKKVGRKGGKEKGGGNKGDDFFSPRL